MADDLLLKYGIQHALHGSFHILDGLINDSVQPYIYTFTFSRGLRSGIRPYIESDNDGIGSTCQRHVGLVDGAHAAVDTLDHNLLVGKLQQGLLHRFHASLYIRLYNQIQLLQVAFLNLREQIVQRHPAPGLLQHLLLVLRKVGLCIGFRRFVAFMRQEHFSCTGNI